MDRQTDQRVQTSEAQKAARKCHPVLHRGKWNAKSGAYDFKRFDHLTSHSASIGGSKIDKVDVDVSLLMKRSKWGYLGDEIPAGVIYIDLTFSHPPGCVLSWATVQVTVADAGEDLKGTEIKGYPAQMTPFFGPQKIVGPESREAISKRYGFMPEAEVMGFGLGGVGVEGESSFATSHRWSLTGRLMRPEAMEDNIYKTLEFKLSENDLEPSHDSKIHTALAFEHGGGAFGLLVRVEGGLKKKHHRLRQGMRSCFGPRSDRPGQHAFTLVGPYTGPRESLDDLAKSLELAMEEENYRRRPLEIPGPQQATFHQVPPPAARRRPPGAVVSGEAAETIGSEQEQPTATSRPSRISSPPPAHNLPSMFEFPTPRREILRDPTLASLANAGRYVSRSGRVSIREDVTVSPPPRSRVSSPPIETNAPAGPSTRAAEAGRPERGNNAMPTAPPEAVREQQGEIIRASAQEISEMQQVVVKTLSLWAVLMYRAVMQILGLPPR